MSWADCKIVASELSGHEGAFETGPGWSFHVERSGTVAPDRVKDLERLWAELPDGEQARCHNPVIGFEVHRLDALVLRAALCYSCNNISIRTADGGDARSFDSSSGPARALLKILKAAL